MIRAEGAEVLRMRNSGAIGDDAMRRIPRDLDFESMLLETRDPVTEPPSEVSAAIEGRDGEE
ncbi:MAG: hypothetical protein JWM41_250 [Gemmatimonadetes bacterium]|nr:hypothetical protein [Gemmatimonadota bacterium]